MKDGFITVAAGTPKIRVADCRYNAEQIFTLMREADKQGVKVLALPELCLTGYTCGDLFLQETLLNGAEEGLRTILEATKHLDLVAAIGLPVRDRWHNKLYNCAAIIQKGIILGMVNILSLLINLIFCWSLFTKEDTISSIVVLQQKSMTNWFTTLLWVLINSILIALTIHTIKKATFRKKQNPYLKTVLIINILINILFLIMVLFSKSADFFLFIYCIILGICLIRNFIRTQKNYYLFFIFLILAFAWYSFGTYEGAARLQIALVGYPRNAYEMGLEELKYYEEKNLKKYSPIEEIKVSKGQMGIIEVKNYAFLKFGTYSEY